jgi:hypothetical protein
MGVKGLAAALKRMGTPAAEPLSAGTTLVVDGDGWVFEALGLCEDGGGGGGGSDGGVLYGGDYQRLDAAVRREVARLRALGLRLVFYRGGPADAFKDATAARRTLQREELWMNLYMCCRGTKDRSKCDLPLPTMAMEQVWRSLGAMEQGVDGGVAIVRCAEEADQPLARAVRALNERHGANTHYCYGRDRYAPALPCHALSCYALSCYAEGA